MAVYFDKVWYLIFIYISRKRDLLLNQRMIIRCIVVWCLCNWPLSGLVFAHITSAWLAASRSSPVSLNNNCIRYFSLLFSWQANYCALPSFHSGETCNNYFVFPNHSSTNKRYLSFSATCMSASIVLKVRRCRKTIFVPGMCIKRDWKAWNLELFQASFLANKNKERKKEETISKVASATPGNFKNLCSELVFRKRYWLKKELCLAHNKLRI